MKDIDVNINELYETLVSDTVFGETLSDRTDRITGQERELDRLIRSISPDNDTLLDIDEKQVSLFSEYEKKGFAVGLSIGIRIAAQAVHESMNKR